MTNDLTQQQAEAGVDKYIKLIGTQLPPGAHMVPGRGTGTLNCFTSDGKDLTGQVFVSADYLIQGVEPAQYLNLADHLRDTWTRLGYRLIDNAHDRNQDRTVRVATPGDDYHLTIYTYGDNRSIPLAVVESPCAWPDVTPSSPSR